MTETRKDGRGSWVALGLWIALGLFVGRAGLTLVMDHLGHGIELRGSLWRLSRLLPVLASTAIGGGLLASVVARFCSGFRSAARAEPDGANSTGRSPVLQVALSSIGFLLLGALFVLVVSGFGIDQNERVPGLQTENGVRAWMALCAGGAIGAILVSLAARLSTRGGMRKFLGSTKSALLPLALMVLSFAGVYAGLAGQVSIMSGTRVERALLEGEPSWEVFAEHPVEQPSVGVITPVVDWRVLGGERPSLVMPPGSAVRFRVTPDDGAVLLRTDAGIDQNVVRQLKPEWGGVSFEFQVDLNDKTVFKKVLSIEKGMEPIENFWHPVGGERGLELTPGDEVVLRTRLLSPIEPGSGMGKAFRIGFSNLELLREWQSERTSSSPDTPNIILVVQDTLRRDRLSTYGYERATTPNLDRLAERGLVFEEAYATSSWTWPSTTSILTGLLSPSHGVTTGSSCYLPSGLNTVSEMLQRGGYTTIGISGNPLIGSSKNFDQGFETFYDSASSFRGSELFMPSALDWIRMNAGTRFFMYLHLVDAHDPHPVRPEHRREFVGPRPSDMSADGFHEYTNRLRKGRSFKGNRQWDTAKVVPEAHQQYLSDLYDGCVATGDYWFGELLDTLDELELTGETVVALTSDHGEELFDHGMLAHSHTVYGEVVRAPLVLAGPGIPSGVRSSTPISNRHLAETLARVGGVRMEGLEGGLDLTSPELLPDGPVFFSTYLGWFEMWYQTPLHGMRQGDWVLHYAPEAGVFGADQPTPGGESNLYSVAGTGIPEGEPANEATQEAELRAFLIESLEKQAASRTHYSVESGEETRGMLEGIGYIEGDEEDE